MEGIHVGVLIGFTYLGRQMSFPQLTCCGEKILPIKIDEYLE
jgi:hypothetical protein